MRQIMDTANVVQGYYYWFDKLTAYCLNIFDYSNLPSTLRAKEIESNLILTGHCVFCRTKDLLTSEYQLVSVQSELFGFDKYYNPTEAVYAQPRLLSKRLKLNAKDVCCIYNCDLENQVLGNEVDGSLYDFISRYARMLADVESTLSIKLVDLRAVNMPTSKDDNTRNSVQEFYNKIALGQRTVVSDSSIVSQLKNVELGKQTYSDSINDILIARDKIFELFMREIGVKFYQSKKAQVNVDEVVANDNMYIISIDDMLAKRKEGIKELNNKFDLNVEVKINEKWGNQYASNND
ncbi:MAG: hypothetical protein NC200_02660 [Candidatus Gastranaerophilales bacterium]|nr:hypothetical protein [Candidatus Gastranaerophilales bacterium]